MKKGLVVITFVVLLIGSVRAATSLQVPVDGDLWTESSSYASNWRTSRNYNPVSYGTDSIVGSYAVLGTDSPLGYYSGMEFVIPGGPLDCSDSWANLTISLKYWEDSVTNIGVVIRIYTEANLGSYWQSGSIALSNGAWYTVDGWNLHNNWTNADGTTPNWSHVYGIGIYAATGDAPYLDATTWTVDGLSFGNVTINPGATSGFPTLLMRSPYAGTNGVFTNAQGISSVDLRWSERVRFDAADISVVDEHGSNVYTAVSGIDSDLMRISFLPPLLNNKFTVTIFDSVVSLERAVAIDGDANGVSGGNTVFVMEHRQKEDMNKDNQVNLGDLEIFANNWLEQF